MCARYRSSIQFCEDPYHSRRYRRNDSLTFPRSIASMTIERAWRNERIRRLIAYLECSFHLTHTVPSRKRTTGIPSKIMCGFGWAADGIGGWLFCCAARPLRLPLPIGRRWIAIASSLHYPVSLIFPLSMTLYFVCSSNIPSDPHRAGLSARH